MPGDLRRQANRCRRGWRCCGCEHRRDEGAQKPQPVEQKAEVTAYGGEHGVVGVTLGEGQEVAAHAMVALEVTDDGFDGGPPRPLDGPDEAALVAGDTDLEGLVLGGVVALWPR